MLDFERIGRNIRISENGVFVERSMDHPGGYVARHALILEVAKTLDLTPKAPDYTILLEVFHDSGAVQLKLPASDQDLDGIPQTLDEPDWLDLSWRCLDCKVPSLMDAVSEARDIHAVNDFARMLAQMNGKTLVIYKALLEARGCRDLLNAELLANQTPSYTFSPQISSPAELAKEELSVLCDNQPFIAKAPLALVFLADYQKWYDIFRAYGKEEPHIEESDLFLASQDCLIAAQKRSCCRTVHGNRFLLYRGYPRKF